MSTTILFCVFASLLLFACLANGLALWLSARWNGVQKLNLRRANLIGVFFVIAPVIIQVIGFYVLGGQLESESWQGWVLFGIVLGIQWLVLHLAIRQSFGRILMVWLLTCVIASLPCLTIALLLRATCVEAYKIPTGGMAPTMFGSHIEQTCEDCGWTYVSGASYRLDNGHFMSNFAKVTYCENCGNDNEATTEERLIPGDRILVDKTHEAKRWDNVIFYFPAYPNDIPPESRTQAHFYVKRLAGLPGEEVVIRRGDVFIDGKRLVKQPGVAEDLWHEFFDSQRVAKFPVQHAMNWKPHENKSWSADKLGGWSCDVTGKKSAELRFSDQIVDWNCYNLDNARSSQPVEDIRLICSIAEMSGDGTLEIIRHFDRTLVTATISMDGKVTLSAEKNPRHQSDEILKDRIEIGTKKGQINDPFSSIVFLLRDGHAYVMNGEKIVASISLNDGEKLADLESFYYTPKNQLSLIATDCKLGLSRIRIDRDVYYLSAFEVGMHGSLPDVVQLGDNEFFMLGDNSPSSSDSRYWGATQRKQLVGVARWCYWPLDRMREFR